MMMGSREAVVDYMTPLGLHHLMATGHHYGPGPWVNDLPAPRLEPGLLSPRRRRRHRLRPHRDRQQRGIALRARGRRRIWPLEHDAGKLSAVVPPRAVGPPDAVGAHAVGRARARIIRTASTRSARCSATWATLAPDVDARRYAEVAAFLAIQEKEAQWWRDACIAYFQSISRRPIPPGFAPPSHDLPYYEAIRTPYAPGNPG